MIKNILFDLDGILADTKSIHYDALNLALPNEFKISLQEHHDKFDGLSTSKKLQILTEEKGLDSDLHDSIKRTKQRITIDLINQQVAENTRLTYLIRKLSQSYKLFCCSNAVYETVDVILRNLNIKQYFVAVYSNERVMNPKPHPAIYIRCMSDFELSPKETLIVEDSINGKQAAISSGAYLLAINEPRDLTEAHIMSYINKVSNKKPAKWIDSKLNVVIPMAGMGSRFAQKGYTFPKPLIDVFGKPMIQQVVENLNIDANYTYIVQEQHDEQYNISSMLNVLTPNCTIIRTNGVTEGAACSVLLAKQYINNDNPLLLANSDQFVEWDSSLFMYSMLNKKADVGILTFDNCAPKWSYVKIDNNKVTEVAEKKVISNHATVGIYFVRQGGEFVKYAEQMIAKNIRVNNEFYVCPVFNEFIADGKIVLHHNIDKMWGLGTPEDLEYFLREYKCK